MDVSVGVGGLGSLRVKAKKGKVLSSCVTKVFYLVMLSTLTVFKCLTKLTDMHTGQTLPLKAGQNFTIANRVVDL